MHLYNKKIPMFILCYSFWIVLRSLFCLLVMVSHTKISKDGIVVPFRTKAQANLLKAANSVIFQLLKVSSFTLCSETRLSCRHCFEATMLRQECKYRMDVQLALQMQFSDLLNDYLCLWAHLLYPSLQT